MTEERRLVTVLFADVTGSTALGEELDPEDLRLLLSRYYAIAKDVVAAHGGTVEKFIGDAVMAVFGLRQAHGDDATRGLAAAVELRDRVRSDPKLGDRLPVRLGVNTGDVVASRDESSGDFLVTGDAVNVAARLQQAASVWSILAGERTVRAAHDDFRFGPEHSIEAKGKPGGIRASEVVGRARAPATRTPLFGRNADLAQLELVARRAFDERRPFLVSVIAPPGTGKSRLLEEFLSRLPSIDPQARVAVAQCLPYGQRLTYWPLRAVLFRVVGLDEESTPDQVRRAVDRWLRDADVEDATEVGALLASTVGAGEAETSDQSALFAAWRTFIEVAGRSSPLVLAVEDLHWSSDSLLDLIDFVLQPRTDTRAMMVVLARPELLDRRPTWGGGRRNHVSIALEPLDDDSIGELVHHLAEGTPPAFLAAVVARAEGNPFFATEIVNSLLERMRSLDDPREIGAALERLPDNVQATVLARLDLLPEEQREVIRVGAVFGRTFRPAGVAALMADGRSAVVADACEQLVERDLIRPSAADGYAFRHILIREVAYGTLPRAARALLHGAAGRWLEASARGREDAFAELVAYHFREAASLSSALELDDAPALRAKAFIWLVRAAEVARAAAATLEARQHVRAAIDFARPEDLPELYELLGDVEIGGSAIVSTYKIALDLARQRQRAPDDQLRILAKMLMIETRSQGSVANRPSFDEIASLRNEGHALLGRSTDQRTRALFLAADAFLPFWARSGGHDVDELMLQSAEASANQALGIARDLDDANLQSAALDALGSIAQDRSDWQRSMELGQLRIAMGTRLILFEQIDAHSMVTWAATVSGDLATAERVSAAGLAIIQPRQAPDWALHLVAWRTLALMHMGRWDEVQTAAERAHGLWVESGRHSAGYSVRGFVAAAIVAHARRDEARIARWSETIEQIGAQFELRREQNRAIARWEMDELADALMAHRQAWRTGHREQLVLDVSICTDAGRQLDEAFLNTTLSYARSGRARLLEAEALRALGLVRQEEAPLVAANEIFAAAGALPYAARTQCELAILRGRRQDLESGLAYLESIRDEVQVERYLHAAVALT
jgi:class 3 adenylate cyclase